MIIKTDFDIENYRPNSPGGMMKFTPEFIAEQRERLQLHPKFGRAVATNIMWSAALDEIERLREALRNAGIMLLQRWLPPHDTELDRFMNYIDHEFDIDLIELPNGEIVDRKLKGGAG